MECWEVLIPSTHLSSNFHSGWSLFAGVFFLRTQDETISGRQKKTFDHSQQWQFQSHYDMQLAQFCYYKCTYIIIIHETKIGNVW